MTDKQRQIIEVWNDFEDADPDISTERLLAMTSSACKCDVAYVCATLLLYEKIKAHD